MLTIEKINNLEKENEQLKEEIEIRTNLEERFRKEALKWADIANSYKKDLDKIEKLCKECPAIDTELSLRILGVINGRD